MNLILLIEAIVCYGIMYNLDIESSLFLRRRKKEIFDNFESNEYFTRIINLYGEKKGKLIYTLTVGVQMLIINVSSMWLAYGIFSGEWNLLSSFTLALFFLSVVHIFGTISNLLGLLKVNNKEVKDNDKKRND